MKDIRWPDRFASRDDNGYESIKAYKERNQKPVKSESGNLQSRENFYDCKSDVKRYFLFEIFDLGLSNRKEKQKIHRHTWA